jgi:hypothetical protein
MVMQTVSLATSNSCGSRLVLGKDKSPHNSTAAGLTSRPTLLPCHDTPLLAPSRPPRAPFTFDTLLSAARNCPAAHLSTLNRFLQSSIHLAASQNSCSALSSFTSIAPCPRASAPLHVVSILGQKSLPAYPSPSLSLSIAQQDFSLAQGVSQAFFLSSLIALTARSTAAYSTTSAPFSRHTHVQKPPRLFKHPLRLVSILRQDSVIPEPCFGLVVAKCFGRVDDNSMHVTSQDVRWNLRHVEAGKDHASCLSLSIFGRRVGRVCGTVDRTFLLLLPSHAAFGVLLPASMSHHSSGFVARLSSVDDRTPLRYYAAHFSVRTLVVLMLDASVRRGGTRFSTRVAPQLKRRS